MKTVNFSKAIIPSETLFTDHMCSFINYTRSFERILFVHFVDAHMRDIIYDLMASSFVIANSRQYYVRCFAVCKNDGQA